MCASKHTQINRDTNTHTGTHTQAITQGHTHRQSHMDTHRLKHTPHTPARGRREAFDPVEPEVGPQSPAERAGPAEGE